MSFAQEYARSVSPHTPLGNSSYHLTPVSNLSDSRSVAPLINSHAPTPVAGYFRIKPAIDRCLTAVFMMAAVPLMACIAGLVWVCDGRPVFYRQTRVGKGGRLFRIWKFRTMLRNAEQNTGAVWCGAADPRITRLGSWLRSSHLDELPQFINVLQGDMNLIGPRPERPEFVGELAGELPSYLERIRVAPGITGLAQIRTGYDRSVADVRRKVAIDLEYLQTASLSLDLRLLAQTLVYIVRHVWQERVRPASYVPLESSSPAAASVTQGATIPHHHVPSHHLSGHQKSGQPEPAPHSSAPHVLAPHLYGGLSALPTGLPLGEAVDLVSPTAWSADSGLSV